MHPRRGPALLLAASLAVALLAGCASPADPIPAGTTTGTATRTGPAPPLPSGDPDTLHGLVVDPAIRPIAGAAVRLVHADRTTTTDAGGRFEFRGAGPGLHPIQVHADGFLLHNASAAPGQELRVVLQPAPSAAAYQLAYRFRGNLECAFEALIISPSCDSALVAVPEEQRPFAANQSFPFAADLGWRTIVVDVVFDNGHPLLDGLRIALRGAEAPGGGGEYEQFGRWHGPESFSVRVEPGATYPDGAGPVPGTFTGFRVEVYPQSKGYHAVCSTDGTCFLGVGAGIDVTFDVYVTVFQGAPAPAGYSLLSN